MKESKRSEGKFTIHSDDDDGDCKIGNALSFSSFHFSLMVSSQHRK